MLDYHWGNPSTAMFTGNEPPPQDENEENRQIFDDHYNVQTFNETLISPHGFNPNHHHFNNPPDPHTQTHSHSHFHPLFDPRAYAASYPPPPMLSLEPVSETSGYMVVPKNEPAGSVEFMSRIGLNLGGRTYFSSSEDDFVNRLYRRSRGLEPGSLNPPRCQAEGCSADLSHAKHYHRRHKVCEFHSKASTVIAAGLTQRFCQQCSRFHLLAEFDNGKRSCRKRLADHNRRRRKSQQPNKSQLENPRNSSSSEQHARSPRESGIQPSSSVTVAVSPPLISLDSFRQRSYQANAFSSAPTSSLFFSNG